MLELRPQSGNSSAIFRPAQKLTEFLCVRLEYIFGTRNPHRIELSLKQGLLETLLGEGHCPVQTAGQGSHTFDWWPHK